MSNKITLSTGFEIAVGDLQEIMQTIIKAGLTHACTTRSQIFDQMVDPAKQVVGYDRTCSINAGLLNHDGEIPEATQHVLSHAFGLSRLPTADDAVSVDSCPIIDLISVQDLMVEHEKLDREGGPL